MLLDTNIVILAAVPGSDLFSAWLTNSAARVSVVTRIEALGFWRTGPAEKATLGVLFDRLAQVELRPNIADRAIALRQRRRMGLADSIIAATALEHGIPLVTRNPADFCHVEDLRVIDPFKLAYQAADQFAPDPT